MADTMVAETTENTQEEEVVKQRGFSTSRLNSFIDRYYLGGNVEHVKWGVENETLHCDFVSGDQSLVGSISMANFPLEDCEVGIYDTAKLIKLLGIMEEEVDISVDYGGDKAIALKLEDSFKDVNFRLGELSIIPETPKVKHLPDFKVDVSLSDDFVSNFIDADKALKDSSTFAVESDGSSVEVILGYSQRGNTNKVVLHPKANEFESMDTTMFDSSLFSEILSANRDSEEMSWEVSSEGISRIKFTNGDFEVTYLLVAKSEGI